MKRMKSQTKLFLILALLCLLTSCYKGTFSVSSVVAQPYVKASTKTMGLSVYITGSVPSVDGLTMVVSSPDGSLSWTTPAKEAIVDNVTYYGSSSLSMPSSASLPTGLWTLNLYYKDGRTLTETFEISYRDLSGALERNSTLNEAVFDEVSNLTVLP